MNDINQPRGNAPTKPDAASAPPGEARLTSLIEDWWHDHFPGSPVAQVTAAWNHALAAKEELKRRFSNLKSGE